MILLKYFYLKTTHKQSLSYLNGALGVGVPSLGISSANACASKLVNLKDDSKRNRNLRGGICHGWTLGNYFAWLVSALATPD